jgi:glycyl-tRNA synthetase beta chain
MNYADLLIEIGTEELPTQAVQTLGLDFENQMMLLLTKAQIDCSDHAYFITPRRIALKMKIATSTPEKIIEHRGPPISAGQKSAQGFADKFNVPVEQLKTVSTEKGEYFLFHETQAPLETHTILLSIIDQALQALRIKKPMSWGSNTFKFVRPVHWALVLLGDKVLEGTIFGQTIGRDTFGHRFLNNTAIRIDKPENYERILKEQGFVIANFNARRNEIKKQIIALSKAKNLSAIMDEDLLDEVSSIVEWPCALLGEFSEAFLKLPKEVISLTLKQNQKCFVLENEAKQLQPYFITIANIDSTDPKQVISGNEKVVRARLSDAAFFFAQDKKHTLDDRLSILSNIVYQQGLGSMLDKSERIAQIAKQIATQLHVDTDLVGRAGLLCKADLTSAMVGEFPELQGIMGGYYAKEDVATAIREHYQPIGANDKIPSSLEGSILSLSDKLDTLISVFSIGKKPTGDKDPFALRRAAIGVLRIIIEKKLFLDLKDYVNDEVMDFIFDRLEAWLKEQSFQAELFSSVKAIHCTKPYDAYLRVQALQKFIDMPEAASLASAHKRVNNLLSKQKDLHLPVFQASLIEEPQEKALVEAVSAQYHQIADLCTKQDYSAALLLLATLKPELDSFFDKVLVMCENEAVRLNRLALLKTLSDLFLKIADLSYLPVAQ